MASLLVCGLLLVNAASAAGPVDFAAPPEKFQKALPPLPKSEAQKIVEAETREVRPEEVEIGPVLASVEGIPYVNARGADGKIRQVHQGQMFGMGDTFQTGAGATARLMYEGGAQVLIPVNAEVAVGQAADKGEAAVPMVDVRRGEVRALVPSAREGEETADEAALRTKLSSLPQGKFKFIVRSRAAVMGVRGTDFIVQSTESGTEVHTLNGVVDVAPDHATLHSGQGVAVNASQYTNAYANGQGVNKARGFEPGEFLRKFHTRHPTFEAMANQAQRDRAAGTFQGLFRKVRENRTRELLHERAGLPPGAGLRGREGRGEGGGEGAGATENREGRPGEKGRRKRGQDEAGDGEGNDGGGQQGRMGRDRHNNKPKVRHRSKDR